MKKVAILQSNYIPWKGYFDLIAAVDEFIIYDDMQFTKNDWRNRNQIKTSQGVQWLTLPVGQDIRRRIRDVVLLDGWQVKHWKTLENNYRRATHFSSIATWLRPIYLDTSYTHLSQLNSNLIKAVCLYLGINTRISCSWDYQLGEGKTERLVDLCMQAGASDYISGPSARDYLQTDLFQARGIDVQWFEYGGYPEYPQLWGTFVHGVSILDLLFNCGSESHSYMKHVA
ncbi:WbqC family protein [Pseudomonas sp. 14P_8.1_Bac3]|uniref:WbqC family protein n=1 Tax=Pseudomonas sp. 14P_8.1_Bac3 TaxID=2971621 RepID=UPI0021C94093|nr:WbqC family protein [Pseudomonas sp. 14P_8.1_Bac3]MCU1762149.1 WbqC family protein [Pseudomonas sp. 14P_8.1_Bac3]